ncbi:MAG TPA: phosphate signaling complex protein PhoU [Steroidobacteraceae bacterium]|nr:phosphate signaling complex protein PhoU [Steroidobacteraceae bacterium]
METTNLTHHISSRFNEDLGELRNSVLKMGGTVEQQLKDAVAALLSGDSQLADKAAHQDHLINALEVAIDEDCSRILATRSPAASDLRLIVAVIKTITDLERVGDEGEKVAYVASRLQGIDRPSERYRELKHLARLAMEQLRGALDAFSRFDGQAAIAVALKDRMLDSEFEAVQRQCITFMMEDPRTIRRALDVMMVARAFERIGDHAKNICEYVVYMVLGKDVRHRSLEDAAAELEKRDKESLGSAG